MSRFFHFLALASVACCIANAQKPTLSGVTIQNWPYIDKIDNKFEGFVVDLMDQIANITNIDYKLYYSPDGTYGIKRNGSISGMLGEVFNNKSDFAVADITITEWRKEFVDFTEPFMDIQLVAVARKENAAGFEKLEDLAKLNDTEAETKTETQGIDSFGMIKTGSTHSHFRETTDPIGKKMFSWLSRHPENLVKNTNEGFSRVNSGKFAFISESSFAEYLVGIYCNITILPDTRKMYPRQYALALPKGSPYLEPFNKAIKQLKEDGTIAQLKAKYWVNRCADPDYNSDLERANLGPTDRFPSAPKMTTFPANVPEVSAVQNSTTATK